jgi:hypothetical protein
MRVLLTIVMSCLCAARLHAEVVAVSSGVAVKDIDIERVTNILLGRVTTWADGSPVIVIVSMEASADQAVSELLGRDTDRLLRGWKRLVYAGSGAMPTVARSNAEAVGMVAHLAGALVVLPINVPAPGCRIIELHPATR